MIPTFPPRLVPGDLVVHSLKGTSFGRLYRDEDCSTRSPNDETDVGRLSEGERCLVICLNSNRHMALVLSQTLQLGWKQTTYLDKLYE